LAYIKDRYQFEAWLGKQPREVAVALAARVALRVLPVVQTAKGYKGCLVVAGFRATAVSWSKAKYPAHETELAAHAAATADTAAIRADANSASGIGSAYAAVTAAAVRTADTYAAVAATRAAAAAALSIDATRVEKGKTTYDIAGWPLWPHGQPDELRSLWQELKAGLLAAKQDWQVWANWYEDRLDGRRTRTRLCAYR
jgi:hypothetical protein